LYYFRKSIDPFFVFLRSMEHYEAWVNKENRLDSPNYERRAHRSCGVLGENIIKEYGERLLRAINNFVEKENLSELVAQKPPSKKVKVANVAKLNTLPKPNVPNESFDEFETDVDFGAIDMP
jgi:hypothetical protein